MVSDTAKSLKQFAESGCEEAFRRLVEANVGLVYGTALRRLGGNTHAAEDVAQLVFCDLARKARSFSPDLVLAGWLYHRTCLRAAEFLRSENRRQARERTASEMNALDRSTNSADPNQFAKGRDGAVVHSQSRFDLAPDGTGFDLDFDWAVPPEAIHKPVP